MAAVPGSSAARGARPGTVTMAMYAIFALAALQLIGAIIAVAAIGATVDAVRDYGAEVGDAAAADTIANITQISSYVVIATALLFAVGFAVLGVFVGRGSNVARIIAWVVLGLSVCCGGFGLLGTAAGNMFGGGTTGDIDAAEMQRRIEAALPGWYSPVSTTTSVLGLLLALAAIILLALPASNPYFRKPEPVWEPPIGSGGGGYPPIGQGGFGGSGQPGYGGGQPGFGGGQPGYGGGEPGGSGQPGGFGQPGGDRPRPPS